MERSDDAAGTHDAVCPDADGVALVNHVTAADGVSHVVDVEVDYELEGDAAAVAAAAAVGDDVVGLADDDDDDVPAGVTERVCVDQMLVEKNGVTGLIKIDE